MPTSHIIDATMCERFVNAASRSCLSAAAAPANAAVAKPDGEALANSFASLAVAIGWGALMLALVALLAIIGWGYMVKHWAEREARNEAAECAKKYMDKWIAEQAPQIISKNMELIKNASLGSDSEDTAADEIGKEAG